MKRLYSIILLMAMAASIGASAESLCLTLHFNSGETAKFAIPEKPVMTFADNKIMVKNDKNVEGIYDRDLIANFDFTMGETAAIGTLLTEGTDYAVEFIDANTLCIAGSGITQASAYNVAAQKVATANASGYTVTLSLENQPSGIYLIEIPGHASFKIKK